MNTLSKLFITAMAATALTACNDETEQPAPQEPQSEYPRATGKIQEMNLRDGINIIAPDTIAFVLYAPGKDNVHLVGDFNNWKADDSSLMEADSTRFWIIIGGLEPGKEYVCQYLISADQRTLRIADPYTHKTSCSDDKYIPATVYPNLIDFPSSKTGGIAMTVSTASENYNWQVDAFSLQNVDDMVVYELLIRDFTTERSIKAAMEKIPYLKQLGVTAIELMPFNEFEGNDSWGYNPSFYFAPDKAYGTPDDYKAFIDACHQNGMAVIMDMVLNHSYGQCPLAQLYMKNGTIEADNPWYNVKSPNPVYYWGYDFNHESPQTQAFVDSVCAYWMKEYKIDGYRFDFTKGFTNKAGDGYAYDASRIAILKRIADQIRKRKNDAIIILEHLTDNKEEKELSQYGFKLWGNMNYNANEATMGWLSNADLSGLSYKNRGWEQPNLLSYMESHDEERLMFKNLQYGNANSNTGYNVKDTATALKRNEAAALILLATPGPKMIWMFGELGYDISIDYNDRTGKKPILWNYYDQPDRLHLYQTISQMNNLRQQGYISTTDYTCSYASAVKYIILRTQQYTSLAIANFDLSEKTVQVNFGHEGTVCTNLFDPTFHLNCSPTATFTMPAGYYGFFTYDN